MMPFYGTNEPPEGDVVPDWLMGGNRKRRIVAALAEQDGDDTEWTVGRLIEDLGCGRSTAYETIRALRALNVLDEEEGGRLRLDLRTDLGSAIAGLVRALEPYMDQPVDRPPRARSRLDR